MAILIFFIVVELALIWFLETIAAPFLPTAWLKSTEAISVIVLYFLLVGSSYAKKRNALSTGNNGPDDSGAVLVAYASQTGVAEELARRTAKALEGGGRMVRLVDFSALKVPLIENARQALFIASTTGEGDPPDAAGAFAAQKMQSPTGLSDLGYAVLALGDKKYHDFCAFGRRIDGWLQDSGANALFDRIDVDCGDEKQVTQWFENIAELGAVHNQVSAPIFKDWNLVGRDALNPGSDNLPVYHMRFEPIARPESSERQLEWQAGDIAVVAPHNDPALVEAFLDKLGRDGNERVTHNNAKLTLREVLSQVSLPTVDALSDVSPDLQQMLDSLEPLAVREYSLASLPSSGHLDLVVRQFRGPDGRLGIGSGWLTEYAPMGGAVTIRLRTNSNFHGPNRDCPMILIGAGSGIAGLRAHMKERIAAGHYRNWLIFGERDENIDYLFRDEIESWHAAGMLERIDLCFMKNGVQRKVQDVFLSEEAVLRRWLGEGAVIYVSGSRIHIGAGVDETLTGLIGDEAVTRLIERNAYKKDVY